MRKTRKILILLLMAGLLVGACALQVAAEPAYEEDTDFTFDEPLGGPPGDPAPCGGGSSGSGGTPG